MNSTERPSELKASRQRVLVVDDEHVIADTLAVILRQHGFETATAYDGAQGCEKAKEFRPDLIISDVVMPGMNGIDAALLIRPVLPECKILLFSGHAVTAGLIHDARILGHDFEVLEKPVHPKELLDRLRSL